MSKIVTLDGRPADSPAVPAIVAPDGQPASTQPQSQAELVLAPFDDGSLFRYSPNPVKPGTFVIHDSKGVSVALARNEFIADILCRGAFLFLLHAKSAQAESEAKSKEQQQQPATPQTT